MLFAVPVRSFVRVFSLGALSAVAPLAAADFEISTGVDSDAWRARVIHVDKAISDFSAPLNLISHSSKASSVQPRAVLEKMPIAFEPADAAHPDHARFVAHGAGYALYLLPGEVAVRIPNAAENSVVHLQMTGANQHARIEGVGKLPGQANYYLGNDPAKWRTRVPQFARVRYSELYNGIDLVFYGKGRQLEYDLIVAPGADPNQIRFAINGGNQVVIDRNGDALVRTSAGDVRLCKPVVYQEIDGTRRAIAGQFAMQSGTGESLSGAAAAEIGFRLAQYDKTRALVIDPVLVVGAGGTADEAGLATAISAAGNTYVTGRTASTDFPVTPGAAQKTLATPFDVVITSFDRDGKALNFSTYFGGDGNEEGMAIAVDEFGTAVVTGYTTSTNLPVEGSLARPYAGGIADAFVAAFGIDGGLVYSTHLGGAAFDQANAIVFDRDGNIIVSGFTNSTDFPTAGPLQANNAGGVDAWVAKLTPDATTLVFSTYLGGSGNEDAFGPFVNDAPSGGVATDADGNVYVAGWTLSPNFPLLNAYQLTIGSTFNPDAFVAKLNPNGSALLYSTYLGGGGMDKAFAIAVNDTGHAFVTGTTLSSEQGDSPAFPTLNAAQNAYGGNSGQSTLGDAFRTQLDTTKGGLASLVYSTYLGGDGDDAGYAISAPDANGDGAYVGGITNSTNFPFLAPGQQSGGSIFRTVDGGATWQRATNGFVNGSAGYSPVLVTALALDPSDVTGNTVYAGTHAGGVFKTVNAATIDAVGPSWTEINTGLTERFVAAVAVDPNHPGTVFAGTDFGKVFKSANGCAIWTEISTGLDFSSAHGINSFVFLPNDRVVLGTAGNAGVFASTDGGAHWNPSNAGLVNKHVVTVAVDPNDPSNLYAGTQFVGQPPGIYKSTDGGENWVLSNANFTTDFYKNNDFFPNVIAFGRGNPAPMFVVATPNFSGDAGGLFRSTDGGTTFAPLVRFGEQGAVFSPFIGFQASAFAIDPANPNNVILGTEVGIYESSDGGQTWSSLGLDSTPVRGAVFDPLGRYYLAGTYGGDDGWGTAFPKSGAPTSTLLGGTGADHVRGFGLNASGPVGYQQDSLLLNSASRDIHTTPGAVAPLPPFVAAETNVLLLREVTNFYVFIDAPPPPTEQVADLEITKSLRYEHEGDPNLPIFVSCLIKVKNNSTDTTAINVEVTDRSTFKSTCQPFLPPGTTFKAAPGQPNTGEFSIESIAPGATVKISLSYFTYEEGSKDAGKTRSNSAEVWMPAGNAVTDPNVGNNRDSATIDVLPNPADLKPKINDVKPKKGKKGTKVSITGSGFCGQGCEAPQSGPRARNITALTAPDTVVKFNGTEAAIISVSDTEIVAEVPEATDGPLTVSTTFGVAAFAEDFVVLPNIQQLLNISTRLAVHGGDKVLIGGFIVTGNDDKTVIVRAIGPSLGSQGVEGGLSDPLLEIHDVAGATIATNDNWVDAPNKQEIIDSTVAPTDDLESAILTSLSPGLYTAVVRGSGDSSGIGLVEAFDLNQASADSQLANISTRGFVDTGDNVMIGGFIIAGGAGDVRVVVRGIGPSLPVADALADPILELHDGNGATIATNDNWRSDQEQEIIDTTVPPTNDAESAIVQVLGPGNYTAIVRGLNGATGVGLVEVYNLQ